jgi:predicted RNase H-like nuclease (RuvC/YqgF family)
MAEWNPRRLEQAMKNAPVLVQYKKLLSELTSENQELKEEVLALRAERDRLRDELERIAAEEDWDKGSMFGGSA